MIGGAVCVAFVTLATNLEEAIQNVVADLKATDTLDWMQYDFYDEDNKAIDMPAFEAWLRENAKSYSLTAPVALTIIHHCAYPDG